MDYQGDCGFQCFREVLVRLQWISEGFEEVVSYAVLCKFHEGFRGGSEIIRSFLGFQILK